MSGRLPADAGIYVVQLLKSAVNKTAPIEKAYACSWEQAYAFAKRNYVVGATWYAVRQLKSPPPAEILDKWQRAVDMAVLRQLLFAEERKLIFQKLESLGISYMQLKGDRLADCYPYPGMRTMADNDILYTDMGSDFLVAQKKMVEAMKELGYTCISLKGVDQPFWKKPFFYFEMHRELVSPDSPYYAYYKEPWRRAISNGAFSYSFLPEDEYVYLVTHTVKHLEVGGAGIRSLLDLYLFFKAHAEMNWDYVEKQFTVLNIAKLASALHALAQRVFGSESLPENDPLFTYLLNCDAYGTFERQWKNDLNKLHGSKLLYIKKRLNPDSETYAQAYPFFYRHKAAKIFLPGVRVFHALCHHPKRLMQELKLLFK